MLTGGNGHGNRMDALNAARSFGRQVRPIDLTPDEARALIDGVFRSHGLDPARSTDPSGWRHLSLGSAHGAAGVVEWQPGEHYLVAFAPIMELPDEPELPADFYKMLLDLNHHGTLAACFSLHDNVVYVGITRPIRGLDEAEVEDAIRAVMTVADSYDEWLRRLVEDILGEIPRRLPELPNIKMTPKEARAIGMVLAACDLHGQDIFRYLMEQWQKQKAGYVLAAGTSGINLKIELGTRLYNLATMRPGIGERRQLIILTWEGLRLQKAFPPKAIDEFQAVVTKVAEVKITESTGQIEVTETFNQDGAKVLLRAMRALIKAIDPTQTGKIEPSIDITVGFKTLFGIQQTLRACEPRVQQMYVMLMEGWNKEGNGIQSLQSGRIDLKLKRSKLDLGEGATYRPPEFVLAALVAPKDDQSARIEVGWNLADGDYPYLEYIADDVAHFQAAVSNLPGFEQRGIVTRLVIGEAFQPEHARALLNAMLALKAAEEGAKARD